MANLATVRTTANALLREHGLYQQGWRFEWDRAQSRRGACHYAKRKITMSRDLTAARSDEGARQTLLHEIAHALTPGHNHDRTWLAKAQSLGYTGGRTSGETIDAGTSRYVYVCDSCDLREPRHRLTRGTRLGVATHAHPECRKRGRTGRVSIVERRTLNLGLAADRG